MRGRSWNRIWLGAVGLLFPLYAQEPGTILVEEWTDVPGGSLRKLTTLDRFPEKPDRSWVLGLEEERLTLPADDGDNYGRRVRGWFVAPLTGNYVFRVTADESAELLIRLKEKERRLLELKRPTRPGMWDQDRRQRSNRVKLEQGKSYLITVLMKEGEKSDHLAVGVELPDGRQEFPVRSRRFHAVAEGVSFIEDRDDDGLSDYEEWVVGSNPDQASSAGDGIPDFVKLLLNHHPAEELTVRPPFDLEWCKAHALPLRMDIMREDTDGDGLSNQEERDLGSNPHKKDSSGDGISDYEMARIFNLPPSLSFFEKGWTPHGRIPAIMSRDRGGVWRKGNEAKKSPRQAEKKSSELVNISTGGYLDFIVPMREAGPQVLSLHCVVSGQVKNNPKVWVNCSVDGVLAGRNWLPTGDKSSCHYLHFVIPARETGWQTVRFSFENTHPELRLWVREIFLERSNSGNEGWQRLWNERSLELSDLKSSRVSPAFLEGRSPYPELLVVEKEDGEPLTPNPLSNQGFYVDVPLKPDGSPVALHLEQSASGKQMERLIRWESSNLFLDEFPLLRPGDALRLLALPEGASGGRVQWRLNDELLAETKAEEPLIHRFDQAGNHDLHAIWSHEVEATQEKRIKVKVLKVPEDYDHVFHLQGGDSSVTRYADAEGLLETADARLFAQKHNGNRRVLHPRNPGSYLMELRAGKGGAVLATRRVESISSRLAQTYLHIQGLPDGKHYILFGMYLSRKPEGGQVLLELGKTGARALDGSKKLRLPFSDHVDESNRLIFLLLQDSRENKRYFTPDVIYEIEEDAP